MGILFEEKNILKQYDRVHEYSGFGLCLPVRGGGFCYDSRLAIEKAVGYGWEKDFRYPFTFYIFSQCQVPAGHGTIAYIKPCVGRSNRYTLANL